MYLHILALYTELKKRAGDSDMFIGSKTEAYRATGLSQGYYSKLFHYLTELGCIVSVQRGSNRSDSIVQLVKPPELAAFKELATLTNLTKRTTLDTLSTEIEQLKRRLPEGVDLIAWMASIEARLADIITKGGYDFGTEEDSTNRD